MAPVPPQHPQAARVAVYAGHQDSVFRLVVDARHAQAYTAGAEGLVARWQLDDPTNAQGLVRAPAGIYAMALGPQRQRLALGASNGTLYVVDVAEQAVLKAWDLHPGGVYALQRRPGTAQVVSAGHDGSLALVDLDTLEVLARRTLVDTRLRALATWPDGRLATAGAEGAIHLLGPDLQPLQRWPAHSSTVFTLAVAPNGELASGGRDARLMRWRLNGNHPPTQTASVVAHNLTVNHAAYTPCGALLATAGKDKTIKLWQATPNAPGWQLLKVLDHARHGAHPASVNHLQWLNGPHELLTVGDDRVMMRWQLQYPAPLEDHLQQLRQQPPAPPAPPGT